MKCFRCELKIGKKEDYFEFNEFHDEKIINTDYCHKTCWTLFKKEFNESKGTLKMAKGMLKSLKGIMQKQGLMQEEVMVV